MNSNPVVEGAAPKKSLAIPALSAALLALFAVNVWIVVQMSKVQQEVASVRDLALTEIARLKESTQSTHAKSEERIGALQEQLEAARRQAAAAVGVAKNDANKQVERLNAELKEAQRQAALEINQVRQAANDVNERVSTVNGEVSQVRAEVASTKSELQKTIDDLKSMHGDLGVMSGLIATNAKELAALRALGDRNYFEFDVMKTRQPVRVGDIAVKLKKVDLKRNRFTMEILADDKLVEKKDKTLNEPVQFYTSAARQPYEIVVNQVQKDRIIGYLATPRVQATRN